MATEPLFLYALLILSGACAGLVSGLFGIGGIIMVPVLLYYFGEILGPNHPNVLELTIGTSLVATCINSFFSFRKQLQKKTINPQPFLKATLPGISLGIIFGFCLAKSFEMTLFKKIFSFLLLFIIALLFCRKKQQEVPKSYQKKDKPFLMLIGFIVGSIASAFGISGGSFAVPLLEAKRFSLKQAISLSSGITLVVATISSLFYFFTPVHRLESSLFFFGSVDLCPVFFFSIFSPFTAKLGVTLSFKLPMHLLKILFAIVLFFLALDFYF